jgi:hypothetical protein
MSPHGSVKNGLNWDDGNVAYHKLSAVLTEAVAGFAHVYFLAPQIFEIKDDFHFAR